MTENTTFMHRLWKVITMRSEDAPSDRLPRIYAIITDHLGTPQQLVDEQRQLVWQALTAPFGLARVTFAANARNGKPFEMNLRLPGQVFDAETGLHYNYLRDYDPALGRYLTPDPMGQGGINPYAYVSDNPLTNIDPLGLYQIDVHYYMTFFLAITAGVTQDTARRIALATQYVDDNKATSPTPNGVTPSSMTINQPALDRYHFVEDGFDPERTWLQSFYKFTFGKDSPTYIADRIKNPASPQLVRLMAASNFAKTDPNATCNSSAQLLGEYLHAFEDTFAHRNQDNVPYNATTFGYGTGHAVDGTNPDYTFNHYSGIPGFGEWKTNETRTLEMEKEVFEKLQSVSTYGVKYKNFGQIESILKEFNGTHASDVDIESRKFQNKIATLNNGLITLGYSGIDLVFDSGIHGYDAAAAKENRNDFLGNLNPSDYVGTILPKGTAPLPKK
ncbi:RHS repeat-associated core domain-containing protein [Janthinobacterium sp. PAMC25594]|uniref:RHS repeat-associated core domain-containing protein n=1 Tax=Janthinobacterium sp. PAMC25594 TaxID=2861284 RepID=UPI001C631066|nr:RHS repeat-associated core domain-containing protein [Janthinobacterium sp. PAMC25594]QYG06667.1 RHS domain-containing protein [Janthinobacterium sp. PAMC25594]